MKAPKVSIVVPIYKINTYVIESIEKTLMQKYGNFEVIVGVDKGVKIPIKNSSLKIVNTGKKNTGPAEKRDLAVNYSKGEIIGFLDDDSYPETDWIQNAVKTLQLKRVHAVCGPGLTPPDDKYWQKVTGGILSSKFGSGPYYYRFTRGSARFVDDYPAYNMFVAKKVLKEVGGYGTKYYGGEDTALCIKVINAGYKIFYSPDIVVYHHRRKFPLEYIKQVGNVGKHRGFFVKKYPQTSFRTSYFLPAMFTLSIPLILLLIANIPLLGIWVLIALLLWHGLILVSESKKNSIIVNLILPVAIMVNYVAYGLNFLVGLVFTRDLIR